MGRLEGQRALVTGGGSGLGRIITLALAREGARVAIADLDRARGAAVLAEAGGQGAALVGDVSDPAVVRGWFEEMRDRFGGLEILINDAGHADVRADLQARIPTIAQELLSGQGQRTPFDATTTLTDAAWSRMFAVHVQGTFNCTRAALALMQPARYGRIVNMASIGATTGIALAPDYSAAKGAIVSFTKAVAREVVGLGITVNAIAPGYIDTPLLAPFSETLRQVTVAQIPIGRLGRPEEVVPSALLLVDPDNGFMTGQVISPNGGQVI